MNIEEKAWLFDCQEDSLVGLLATPVDSLPRHGVLVVVGGPQYRIGSHRQFWYLAQHLAQAGHAVMRFDYRGMGDSTGKQRNFEQIEEDISTALHAFFVKVPTLSTVTLWGLCDGASASLLYAHRDPRITGVVMVNPWVRTELSHAQARIKHYYIQRLLSRELWQKIYSLQFDLSTFIKDTGRLFGQLSRHHKASPSLSLPDRMLVALNKFAGQILLLLSEHDLTAREFSDLVAGSFHWQQALEYHACERHTLDLADHTFSRKVWRDQVLQRTQAWLR